MFVMRALLWPAPGKAPALRDALLSTAKADPQSIIAQRLWGEAPMFSVNRAFPDLAALDTWRRSWRPSPTVAEHFGRPPSSALWEVPQAPTGAPAATFTVRFTFEAAAGKGRELRELLEQRRTELASSGRNSSLWVRVSGGPLSLAMVAGHDSLAAIEQVRAAALADPATQTYQQRLTPLLATSVEAPDWFEILSSPA